MSTNSLSLLSELLLECSVIPRSCSPLPSSPSWLMHSVLCMRSSTSSSGRKASGDDDKDFRRGGEEVGVRHESIEDLPEDVCFLYPAKKRRRRHLVSPFPRILKSDIRRIMSNMYANVLNSTDINLIASFYNQFCVSSCRSIDYANSPIIPQKVTVKRLDGVQSMVERLGQLLPQIPDFIFQLNRSYIQQELDKPGSTVVMEVQVKGTHLADPLVCIMDQHNESHTLPQSVLEEIQSSGRIANGHIRSYAYVNTPHELDVLAIISCSLDSNHRIYKMESNLEYRRPAASPALVIKQEPHGT